MKTAIIEIGNPLKKDDNIGNLLIEKLSKEIKDKNFVFIKAYQTPENYLSPLKKEKPEMIYILDAVEFKGTTGEVKVFSLNDISLNTITTHNIPVTVYKNYFPDATIKIIGIKVKDTNFGEELSKEIKNKFDEILKEVKKIIS